MARTKQRVRKSPIGQGKAPRKTLVVGGKNRPGPVGSGSERKPHRFRAGTRALMEIRRFQKTTDSLLPRAPFNALVREAIGQIQSNEFKDRTALLRFSSESLEAIRDATEAHQLYLLTRTCAAALHAHRVTARQADLEFTEGMVGLKELLVLGEKPRKQRAAEAAADKEARIQARVDEKRREELEKSDARKAVDRIHAAVTARKDKADAKGKAADDTDSEPEDSNPEGSDEEEEDEDDAKDETVAMKTNVTTETDAQKRRREDREAKQLSIEAGKRINAQSASASASSSSASSATSSSSSAAAAVVTAPTDKEADNEPAAMLD